VQPIDIPLTKFSHVHVDLVGPLPPAVDGATHLLTVVDRTTRWPEVQPIKGTTAQVVADAFVSVWVSRFGVPATVTTDRGPQFLSGTWACLSETLGFKHLTTTAYHPQSNGMVERLHRQIKESLRARSSGLAWADHLPWVLLGLRAAPKDEANVSTAEVTLGVKLALPGPALPAQEGTGELPSFLPSTCRTFVQVAATPPKGLTGANEVIVGKDNLTGRPLAPLYAGPFKVIEKRPKAFKILMGKREDWVSVDRLKAYVPSSEDVL